MMVTISGNNVFYMLSSVAMIMFVCLFSNYVTNKVIIGRVSAADCFLESTQFKMADEQSTVAWTKMATAQFISQILSKCFLW